MLSIPAAALPVGTQRVLVPIFVAPGGRHGQDPLGLDDVLGAHQTVEAPFLGGSAGLAIARFAHSLADCTLPLLLFGCAGCTEFPFLAGVRVHGHARVGSSLFNLFDVFNTEVSNHSHVFLELREVQRETGKSEVETSFARHGVGGAVLVEGVDQLAILLLNSSFVFLVFKVDGVLRSCFALE